MEVTVLIDKLTHQPELVEFSEVIETIDAAYHFSPTAFTNGETVNEANQNNGSCKIFAFAKLNDLTEQQALACFGDFYRKDVLLSPENDDHQNIRNFIRFGWQGIQFSGEALTAK